MLSEFLAIALLLASATADEDRTLEAIQIEGEIDVPQVLFITSRDHPRFRDGLRERYHKTALEVGNKATWPRRLRVLAGHSEPVK